MATKQRRINPFSAATYGNVAYDVSRSNAAPELEREERRELDRIPDSSLEQARKPHTPVVLRPQQKVSITAIAGFVMVAMLAVGVLASYIQLNSIYANTVTAQATLTQLESNYAKLQAEDEEIFDSDSLRAAADAAGLSKPTASQQIYLELADPDSTVVYEKKLETTGIAGCWNTVKSFFYGVGAYFS